MGRGTLKIGTLHDFKDTILHGNERGDALEGDLITYNTHDIFNDTQDLDPLAKNFFSGMIDAQGCYNLQAINCKKIISSRNCFVFCTSTRKQDSTLQKEFGDICLSIENIDKFLNICKEAIKKELPTNDVINTDIQAITYQKKERHYREETPINTDPKYIKNPCYAYQHEVRFVWEMRDANNIEPIILTDEKIKSCFKLVT